MIGAVVSVGGNRSRQEGTDVSEGDLSISKSPFALCDLLGRSLLHRFLEQVRESGISNISVIPEEKLSTAPVLPTYATLHHANKRGFWPVWNAAVQGYVSQGAETLLLVRLGAYSEVDIHDLLRRHQQTGSSFMQVFTDHGPIDFVVVKTAELAKGMGSFRNRLIHMSTRGRRYRFIGYTNALQSVEDFRNLTSDALYGRCRIRPVGQEIEPRIWVDDGAVVEPSARIYSPAYIGRQTRIGEACAILDGSAVERECVVDSGTILRDCNVLPNTYVGPGLTVEGAVLSKHRLFHIGRRLELQIRDPRMLQAIQGRSSLTERIKRVIKAPYRNICRPSVSTLLEVDASVQGTYWSGASAALTSGLPGMLTVPPQAGSWEKPSQ